MDLLATVGTSAFASQRPPRVIAPPILIFCVAGNLVGGWARSGSEAALQKRPGAGFQSLRTGRRRLLHGEESSATLEGDEKVDAVACKAARVQEEAQAPHGFAFSRAAGSPQLPISTG